MRVVARMKDIMLTPRSIWPMIAAEQIDTLAIYSRYVMPLAAIPALAGFMRTSLFGVGAFGVSVRVPISTGLLQMGVSYSVSLVIIHVWSLIGNFLAPRFAGQRNPANALKLVAYGSTAALLGGMFAVSPALWVLMLAASLYSIYLVFLGAPALMRVPASKALSYTAVLTLCGIVLGALLNTIVGAVLYASPAAKIVSEGEAETGSPSGEVTMDTPNGTVTFDMGAMQAWSAKIEALGHKLEEAQQSGDTAAFQKTLEEMNKLQNAEPSAR